MVGTPGSGKSVLMNAINLGVALSPQVGTGSKRMTARPFHIDHDVILARFEAIKVDAEGDVARMLELLLLENELLRHQSSAGFLRGSRTNLLTYPRFISLIDDTEERPEEAEQTRRDS
jgi:hypothetical protein